MTARRFAPGLVLAAGSLILLLAIGSRAGQGLFLRPMTAEFGWSREAFSFALAIYQIVFGLGSAVLGAVADKYGTGRVIFAAAITLLVGTLMQALGESLFTLNLGTGVLAGIGVGGCGFGVVMAAMARAWPAERRSFVYGVGTAVSSLGQFLLVPLIAFLIGAFGWKMALLFGAGLVALILPLAIPLQGKPAVDSGPQQSLGAAVREAGSHSGFLLLAGGYFVCGFHVAFIGSHLPAYLADNGFQTLGGWALSFIGLFNVVGSFASGLLGQKGRKKYLLAFIYFGRAAAILLFILMPLSQASVLLFAAFMGLFWLSTVPLTTGLVGQIFGMRYLASLAGVVFLAHQVGGFLGVWLGGRLYDLTGSYIVVWWIAIGLGVFAGLCNLPINDRTLERAPTPPLPA